MGLVGISKEEASLQRRPPSVGPTEGTVELKGGRTHKCCWDGISLADHEGRQVGPLPQRSTPVLCRATRVRTSTLNCACKHGSTPRGVHPCPLHSEPLEYPAPHPAHCKHEAIEGSGRVFDLGKGHHSRDSSPPGSCSRIKVTALARNPHCKGVPGHSCHLDLQAEAGRTRSSTLKLRASPERDTRPPNNSQNV